MNKKLKNTSFKKTNKININSMNEDLKQWLTEEDKISISKKIKTHKMKKKPHGLCQICGINAASEVCIKCSKSVCNTCYLNLIGLCEKCLTKESVEKWKNRKPDWKKALGVDWVD